MDPYTFDLFSAIKLIELHGEKLERLVWLEDGVDAQGYPQKVPGRLDMCECENMFKCPNGTFAATGSASLSDCVSNGVEVLRRVSIIPTWYNETYPEALAGRFANMTDFWELGGADSTLVRSFQTYPIGTIRLDANDVATVTLDMSTISYNLTYGEHYRISVYVDCKPCPARYGCNYEAVPPTCDSLYPSLEDQTELFNLCLGRYNLTSCMTRCERYILPYFFLDNSVADLGQVSL
ncbi:hypothetical protein B484DRAFT_438613 [Ochromonadaceae sp. CCMP2298]|nr:hypothetical protein B484DRAFT_438613 [Ochromonadaceae sp. CCMP2298]